MAEPWEELRQVRLEKLEKLKEAGINPYPSFWEKWNKRQFVSVAEKLALASEVVFAGRLRGWRQHGKLVFGDLQDFSGRIQLVFKKDVISEEKFKILDLFDLGDFIGVYGQLMKTKTGQLSVLVQEFKLLSKTLRSLPSEWFGLEDTESRYRQRYLDLLLNPEVKERFILRSKLVEAIRQYLQEREFIELDTPAIQPIYGGTNAKPFETHINSLDADFYLRIASELYLKRLVVGGFEKVFEICKDFRNEGLDQTHHPEFTMIEYYQAYANYEQMMELTEGLFKFCCQKLSGGLELEVGDRKIDLSGKWQKMSMKEAVKKYLQVDYEQVSVADLKERLSGGQIEFDKQESKESLFFKLFDHFVPPYLIEPTWIVDYPEVVSPLSKGIEDQPGWVERFEGYIGGKEICDGWTEINDPLDQRRRFEENQSQEEAHPVDESFLTALEYGMPPLTGIGIGIDRLTMFFSNTWNIKEIILFPLLRKESLEN